MPEALDPHTLALVQAIEKFMENPPRDMPDGLGDQLKSVGQTLRGYGVGDDISPGMKDAAQATDGTGESYKVAATGKDVPSPGQQEFDAAMEAARQAFAQGTNGASAGQPG